MLDWSRRLYRHPTSQHDTLWLMLSSLGAPLCALPVQVALKRQQVAIPQRTMFVRCLAKRVNGSLALCILTIQKAIQRRLAMLY
jgi:hypothetical protein